jgi:hypothetical protein
MNAQTPTTEAREINNYSPERFTRLRTRNYNPERFAQLLRKTA